jgi:hypothetical protein
MKMGAKVRITDKKRKKNFVSKNDTSFPNSEKQNQDIENLGLEELKKKEIELRLHIDELEEEIYHLERQILGEPVSDEETREVKKEDVEEEEKGKKKQAKKSKNNTDLEESTSDKSDVDDPIKRKIIQQK